ncbi:hypothetical protein BHE74_00056471 [Ensete ventricosum]|nr:hypothetical protein BHE74_00056471 [Ensete ventricosum]
MPSYPSTTPAVLAARHASAGKGVNLTCVRSTVRLVVRPLAPPSLRPTSFPRRVDHVGGPVRELGNLNGAGADLTKQELGNLNGAGADSTEHELGNLNGAGADPTEHAREFEWCRS